MRVKLEEGTPSVFLNGIPSWIWHAPLEGACLFFDDGACGHSTVDSECAEDGVHVVWDGWHVEVDDGLIVGCNADGDDAAEHCLAFVPRFFVFHNFPFVCESLPSCRLDVDHLLSGMGFIAAIALAAAWTHVGHLLLYFIKLCFRAGLANEKLTQDHHSAAKSHYQPLTAKR